MALRPPQTLSPSKVAAFKDCAMAFRFSVIERLPEPPSVPATRGTLVHAALERLFDLPPAERTPAAAQGCLAEAIEAMRSEPDFAGLGLDEAAEHRFLAEASSLVEAYFELEDPASVHPIGLELRLSARVGDLELVGIIDRLELDGDGGLVVTDYKTGRAPSVRYEQGRLGGVQFYSLLCEEVFGTRPARVQLLYLQDPIAISTVPSEQSTRGLRTKVGALWSAVERACAREDFRPRPGPLCDWCAFQAWCPAFGGNPADASVALRGAEPAPPLPFAS